jgi:tetratricopeptide (TPR) repeat protein
MNVPEASMHRLMPVAAVVLTLLADARPAAAAQRPPVAPSVEATADSSMLKELAARRRAEIDKTIAARDWPRAETLLVAEIERTQKPVDLLRMLAGVFMNEHKPLNAAIAIKKAETYGPLDANTRLQLVLAYISMRRSDWARPELERLVAADPLNTGYAYWLARLDYDSGRYAAAIDRLKTVVQREPSFMRAYDNLGLCYEALNQPDEAIRQYREAIRRTREAGEKWPWPFLNLGILLKNSGQIEEAEALFNEALQADPAFAPALYHLGTILEASDRTEGAVQTLLRSAAADPSYAAPHFALSRIYRRQGRIAEADAALATFQQLHQPAREVKR